MKETAAHAENSPNAGSGTAALRYFQFSFTRIPFSFLVLSPTLSPSPPHRAHFRSFGTLHPADGAIRGPVKTHAFFSFFFTTTTNSSFFHCTRKQTCLGCVRGMSDAKGVAGAGLVVWCNLGTNWPQTGLLCGGQTCRTGVQQRPNGGRWLAPGDSGELLRARGALQRRV